MSTTSSMYMGLAFLILAVTAVVLQAWLWNPKYWDESRKRSHAPPLWMLVHRVVGYTFLAIYVVMMWHMVPRLWEYQVELPARTVIHAVVAICLGVLLLTKISILRWFRYFEEAMPKLGLGILMCTVVLVSLSIPFAARAHGFGAQPFTEENLARVERIVAELQLEPSDVVSEEGFAHGRDVLVTQCTRCHDMRTILAKPRTGKSWFKVIDRMTEKPSVFGDPIDPSDVPYVTAYMVAITPEIQESAKARRQEQRAQDERNAEVAELEPDTDSVAGEQPGPEAADPKPATPPAPSEEAEQPAQDDETPAGAAAESKPIPKPKPKPKPKKPPPAPIDPAKAKKLLQARCTECHELDEIEAHGGDSVRGWARVIRTMVTDEGAEVSGGEASMLARYLAQEHPK